MERENDKPIFVFANDSLTDEEKEEEIERLIAQRNRIMQVHGYKILEDGTIIKPDSESIIKKLEKDN